MTTLQAIEIIEIPCYDQNDYVNNIDNKIEAYQFLIDNGIIWKLQGSYVSMALALIDDGLCFYNDTVSEPTLDTFSA